jgi:hypothetical protein
MPAFAGVRQLNSCCRERKREWKDMEPAHDFHQTCIAGEDPTPAGVRSRPLRRLRIFGQRDKLKADRSKGA